jgi:hypothetical protein
MPKQSISIIDSNPVWPPPPLVPEFTSGGSSGGGSSGLSSSSIRIKALDRAPIAPAVALVSFTVNSSEPSSSASFLIGN